MSKTLLACVLTWVGRTRADLKHKAAWAQLKDHFDQLLCDDWQRAAANCVTRPAFIRGHRSELQLFLDMEKVTAVEAQLEANEQLKVADVDGLVNSSSIGSVLYAAESSQMESMGFCNDIKTRLYELEVTHQFEAQELEAFKAIMMAAADQLDEDLWKHFDNKALPIPFFDTNIGGQVSNPNDEWAFPLEARLKTLGVSGLQVERTLYERNLYGSEEPIPGVATAITVPDSLLYDIKNARQYLNQQIGDTWQTTEQMKETFRACYAEAKKLDESIWMDLEFLENEYDELMERKLKRCVLETLPSTDEPVPRSIAKALVAARMLSTGDIAVVQKKSLQNCLNGAVRFLEDVSEARGPTMDELSKGGDFLLVFAKRAENLSHVIPDAVLVDGGKAAVQKRLYGAEAIRYRYGRCVELVNPDSVDLREFRAFRWLLSDDENAQFLNWERSAVHNAKARMKEAKAKAILDIENDVKNKKKADDGAAQSQIVPAPPLKPAKRKKVEVEAAAKSKLLVAPLADEVAVDCGVMSFFGMKAI